MMNNLIVVDRSVGTSLAVVDKLLEEELFIIVLVVDNDQQRSLFQSNKKIGRIVTVAEIDRYDSTKGIDYQIIKRCKGAQLWVENALTRFDDDYNDRKYVYYMGLSFWNEIFQKYSIDLVFVNSIMHGLPYDGILRGLASVFEIPYLTVNNLGINPWNKYVRDDFAEELIPVRNQKRVERLDQYLISEDPNSKDKDVLHLDVQIHVNPAANRLKNGIIKLIYDIFGELGIEFFHSIRNGTFGKKYPIGSTGFLTSFWERLRCHINFLHTQRFYNEHVKKVNLSEKYIYFSLHFEPEGNIQCRMTMESQLLAIKMLHDCLPTGWKIVVKEHPYQMKVNTEQFSFMLHNIDLFKTIPFYRRIVNMKHVILASRDCASSELVAHAQGVAVLQGSVVVETVIAKKPLLLFSEMHPLSKAQDVFCCFSYQACREALETIESGFVPTYSDALEIMNQYVFASEADYRQNCVDIIKNKLEMN